MQDSFTEFLTYTNSQHDVSLVLAKDEAEKSEMVNILKQNQFQEATSITQLLQASTQPSKIFYQLNELPSALYNFIFQYPTGQLQIFNPETNSQEIVTPIYNEVSIILVTTHDALEKIESTGFFIRDKVGLTYQS